MTTRGCPFNCNFCASTFLFGKKIRRRSPADVVDEMEHLVRHYGIREIHIEDDNPTLVRKHIDALCEELRRRNWKTPWKFPNGIMVMTADADLLRMMKDAGCYQISLGIETANEETDLGKSVPVQKVFEITREARRIGLETVGLFVVGLPNETPAMMRKTIGQSLKMGLDFAHFGIYVPLPGSRWGREATETKRRFLGINFFSASQRTSKEAREVKWLQRRAVLSFYLRPRTLLKIAQVLKAKQLPGFLYTFRRYVFS
ncbi:MAG: radical SAM protein [Deltaproteobacteria bacterium]|nr:radical SAM protein [Deltaproteobacteria bacterium]